MSSRLRAQACVGVHDHTVVQLHGVRGRTRESLLEAGRRELSQSRPESTDEASDCCSFRRFAIYARPCRADHTVLGFDHSEVFLKGATCSCGVKNREAQSPLEGDVEMIKRHRSQIGFKKKTTILTQVWSFKMLFCMRPTF